MYFNADTVFSSLFLVKRKLGLSGRKTKKKAAERAGNVESMMYIRHDDMWIEPVSKGERERGK